MKKERGFTVCCLGAFVLLSLLQGAKTSFAEDLGPTATITPVVDNWQTRHEKADPEAKKDERSQLPGIPDALPNVAGKEDLFIKIGYGTYGARVYFLNYNRPDVNGISSQVDTIWGLGDVASSLSVGLDFPDGFSCFASDDRFPDGGAFLVNIEYSYPPTNPVPAYFFAGAGLDLYGDSLGPGFQLGLGTNFALAPHYTLFVETKLIGGFGNWTVQQNDQLSYTWADVYWPILAGMKFNL